MKTFTFFIFALFAGLVYSLSAARIVKEKPYAIVHKRNATLKEIYNIYVGKVVDQDTSRKKYSILPEVGIVGVKGIQEIGLSNLEQQAGYRGNTLDKIAVYIPHPASSNIYVVEAITLYLHRLRSFEEKFEEGKLRVRICEAVDVSHPPGVSLLSKDYIVDPKLMRKFREGKQEIRLETPMELPMNGLYVVAEWEYVRNNKDLLEKKTRSAPLAANLSLAESYTWTSIGDFKQSWQREGEINSLSKLSPYYKGKIYNALMGVKVKERE